MSSDQTVSRRDLVIEGAAGITAAAATGALGAGPPQDGVAPVDSNASIRTPEQLEAAVRGGGEIRLGSRQLRVTTTVAPAADTRLTGHGARIIGADSSRPVLSLVANGIALADLQLEGAAGRDVRENSAALVRQARDVVIEDVAVSGVAGSAFHITGGANHAMLSRLRVRGLGGGVANASDVMLYNTAFQTTVQNSHLAGGRAVGVYCQLNSAEHKILFNYVDHHTAYGILDYDIAPRATYTLILGNSVADISGSEPIQGRLRAGAGVYTADVGGQIIAHNHVTNCNTATTDETLAPGGIGVAGNSAPAPTLVSGNYAHYNGWYGIMLLNQTQSSPVIGNVLLENKRDQLYFKNSDHAFAVGNSLTALTQPTTQERCIAVNMSGTGRTGALLVGNRTRGGSFVAIDVAHSAQSVVVANNVSECTGRGVQLANAAAQVITGNMIDVSAGNGIALNLIDVSDAAVSACVLKVSAAAPIALATSGRCSGTRIDKTLVIAGKPNPMDYVENAGTGCIVEQWGTGAPTRLMHQPGDTVWNNAPAVGAPMGWRCVAAGRPGRWRALPAL